MKKMCETFQIYTYKEFFKSYNYFYMLKYQILISLIHSYYLKLGS